MSNPTRSLGVCATTVVRRGCVRLAAMLMLSTGTAHASPSPTEVPSILLNAESVAVDGSVLRVGESTGKWTLMSIVPATDGPLAILENFSEAQGEIIVVRSNRIVARLRKSIEPSFAESSGLYRGHSLEDVMNSDEDLLGREILGAAGDPNFDQVSACLPPITKMFTYTFVGTRESFDKVGFAYGGRSPTFDPAIVAPSIRKVREDKAVADGLVGGWLPVVRFVFPEESGAWTEMLAFAPFRSVNGNPWVQPVWYRVVRVEEGRLKWARYFDTYLPFPPKGEPPAADFYADLLAMKTGWEKLLADAMEISVPEPRVADQAKHSLVRAIITHVGNEPKYGVLDRNYGGVEHDGFPDTFNTETATLSEWGLIGLAAENIETYFGRFVRDDGSLLYRGPETGQYGRMLTVVAQFVNAGGDPRVVLKFRERIDAIAKLLLLRRDAARALSPDDPAYGMIAGWSEADSSIDPDPDRYVQPYLGNSTEAARGFHELGELWQRLGREHGDANLATCGRTLQREAEALEIDLQRSIQRSILTGTSPPCLPAIAGVKEPFHVIVPRDNLDPLFRGYRSYMEMLFSGNLTREQVGMIVRYRSAHRDLILGLPTAYGYDTHELAGFLSYGHAYGLLQHDFVREYLLTFYSAMAHQYTRGTWTAPETRNLNGDAAPYCVPAQLVVPMLTRWMLAWEDPRSEILWLAKATPREWLEEGKEIAARRVPTRWGRLDFTIHSHLRAERIDAVVNLPSAARPASIKLRLRLPDTHQLTAVTLNGKPWTDFDPGQETISIPASVGSEIAVTATCRKR